MQHWSVHFLDFPLYLMHRPYNSTSIISVDHWCETRDPLVWTSNHLHFITHKVCGLSYITLVINLRTEKSAYPHIGCVSECRFIRYISLTLSSVSTLSIVSSRWSTFRSAYLWQTSWLFDQTSIWWLFGKFLSCMFVLDIYLLLHVIHGLDDRKSLWYLKGDPLFIRNHLWSSRHVSDHSHAWLATPSLPERLQWQGKDPAYLSILQSLMRNI